MGYQRILNPKGVQTFYGKKSQKNKQFYEGWKMEVCNVKNMTGITQNNKLEFQRPP